MNEKRIAVCDDEKIIADHLAEIVRKCIASMDINASVTVDVFYSAFALDDAVDSGNIYDLIFMDIILKKENGIYLSDNILKKMNHVKIVFVTGYVAYVEDIFDIEPFALLVKPIKEEKVLHILEKAFQAIESDSRKYIRLKTRDGVFKIDIDTICYVESNRKYVNFTDIHGNVYEVIMTMDEVERLAGQTLLRCHRCYYINLDKVSQLHGKNAVFDDGKEIPISRSLYQEIYQKFMDRLESYWDK